jgi:hypothetical protein
MVSGLLAVLCLVSLSVKVQRHERVWLRGASAPLSRDFSGTSASTISGHSNNLQTRRVAAGDPSFPDLAAAQIWI